MKTLITMLTLAFALPTQASTPVYKCEVNGKIEYTSEIGSGCPQIDLTVTNLSTYTPPASHLAHRYHISTSPLPAVIPLPRPTKPTGPAPTPQAPVPSYYPVLNTPYALVPFNFVPSYLVPHAHHHQESSLTRFPYPATRSIAGHR